MSVRADVVGVGVGALDVGEAGVGDGEADEWWLGEADAGWEARADAEAGALAGCDVPWDDDAAALAGEDAFREAAGEEDAEPGTPGAPVVMDRLSQRRPGHICRSQPRHRAVDVRVHHHGREHAAHPPRCGDLPPEPIPELRIRRQLSADDLDRDRPSARGDAEEHPPHATAAKLAYQPVRADRLRIARLQALNHAGPPTSPKTSLYGISDRTAIITAHAN